MSTPVISVFLADDTPIAREGLKRIIETVEDIRVIGEASSAHETPRKVVEKSPDILLIDLKWYGDETAGWSAIKEIKTLRPEIRIIALTAYENLLRDARRAGADAAITKTFTRSEILHLIREVMSIERRSPTPTERKSRVDDLTSREQDVLNLLSKGFSNKELSKKLNIAEATAKNHVKNILSKLGAKNRLEATKIARESGFFTNR